MPVVKLPGGGTAIVCVRGRAPTAACSVCGKKGADKLCDGSPPKGARRATCDVRLCARCARHVDPDKDYCPRHPVAGEQTDLRGDT